MENAGPARRGLAIYGAESDTAKERQLPFTAERSDIVSIFDHRSGACLACEYADRFSEDTTTSITTMSQQMNKKSMANLLQSPPITRAYRPVSLAIGLSVCTVGSIYTSHSWLSLPLILLDVVLGCIILIELITRSLAGLVNKQRWRYRIMDEGKTVVVPNRQIGGTNVKRLFAHPDASSKSAGGLRMLINWWQAPCSEYHQEVMERGPVYDELRKVTARLLSRPLEDARQLALERANAEIVRQQGVREDWSIMKLRTMIEPIGMSFCYEFMFREPCPPATLAALCASNTDVLVTTGSFKRRDISVRRLATDEIKLAIDRKNGLPEVFGESCSLDLEQKALYLQGVWTHTGVTQILRLASNAICHLSRNPGKLRKFKADLEQNSTYADAVLLETLRLNPGVETTNRVVTKDVRLEDNLVIEAFTNIVFNLESYHLSGFDKPDEFIPERWTDGKNADANFMPFGAGKRRCPAERFVLTVSKEIIIAIVSSLDIYLPSGSGILFSKKSRIANDLCCVVRRPTISTPKLAAIRIMLSMSMLVGNIRKGILQLKIMRMNGQDAYAEYKNLRARL
jgi:hypothetical protein